MVILTSPRSKYNKGGLRTRGRSVGGSSGRMALGWVRPFTFSRWREGGQSIFVSVLSNKKRRFLSGADLG